MGNKTRSIIALCLAVLLVWLSMPALADAGSGLEFSGLGKKDRRGLGHTRAV